MGKEAHAVYLYLRDPMVTEAHWQLKETLEEHYLSNKIKKMNDKLDDVCDTACSQQWCYIRTGLATSKALLR